MKELGDQNRSTVEPLPGWQLKTFEAYLPHVLGVTEPEHQPLVRQARERFDAYVRSIPAHESRARDKLWTLMAWTFVHGSAVGHGTLPWNQSLSERERYVERFFESDDRLADHFWNLVGRLVPRAVERATVRDLAKSLREVMGLAFYSNPASDGLTGYERVWQRAERYRSRRDFDVARLPPPQPAVFEPTEVARVHFQGHPYATDRLFHNDGRPRVAVIGSGAGGAVVAAQLAATGRYDVAVFEAGPRLRPGQFPLDTLVGMNQLFEDGLMTLSRNLDLHLLRGRLVGGGTVLTSGLSVRLRARTQSAWTSGLEPETYLGIDSQELDAAFDAIRARQHMGRLNEELFTDVSALMEIGARRTGGYRFDRDQAFNNVMMHRGQYDGPPIPNRNGAYCIGCGLCNYGCYFGQKMSMDLTYIPDAESAGAQVHANLPIEHLVGDYQGDGEMRVVALELGRDLRQRVPVDHVVLACGAVGSPALLKRSAHADPQWRLLNAFRDGWVGTHLGFNYGSGIVARFPAPFQRPGHLGFQIKYVATKPSDEDFTLTGSHHAPYVTSYVLENAFVPPALMSNVVPGVGRLHREWMEQYTSLAMAATTIGSPLHGEIDGDRDVHYRLSESEVDYNVRSLAALSRLYLAAGAEVVGLAGIRQGRSPRDPDDPTVGVGLMLRGATHGHLSEEQLYRELRSVITEPEHLMLSSSHPQGGLRMAATPGRGAVDANFRLRGAHNVFVADASLFPSTIVVNPQWTIASVAMVASRRIGEQLSAHSEAPTS